MADISSCKTCRYFDSKDWDSETKNWCRYNDLPAINEGLCGHHEPMNRVCPFCKHTTLLELYPNDRQRVAEYLWNVLLNDLYEIAKDTEDHKDILVLDRRVRNFIRATRVKE